jgi:hypothetical protein
MYSAPFALRAFMHSAPLCIARLMHMLMHSAPYEPILVRTPVLSILEQVESGRFFVTLVEITEPPPVRATLAQ